MEQQKVRITKGHKETLGNHGYAHYFDCADDEQCIHVKTYQIIHICTYICSLLYVHYT